jgi:hypothetical protein
MFALEGLTSVTVVELILMRYLCDDPTIDMRREGKMCEEKKDRSRK